MISSTRLFVGNLPENTEENDLRSAFAVFGEIVNLDLKSKPGETNDSKKFAFVSLSAANVDVESCIKHFSNEDFKGNRLYVTRARESFLERLQRERQLAQKKDADKAVKEDNVSKKHPIIKLSDKLNPRKRKLEHNHTTDHNPRKKRHARIEESIDEESNYTNDHIHKTKGHNREEKNNIQTSSFHTGDTADSRNLTNVTETDKKKHEAEKKRMESMKKKRQEFKEKKMIIKSGLTGVDKVKNKKVIFTDYDNDDLPKEIKRNNKVKKQKHQKSLFDDDADDSDDELNFEVKKQYEGKQGQKVLDLQSRYKSDKRFTLDERFIDDEDEGEENSHKQNDNEEVELRTEDEKTKQMNILQDVLGVTIKQKYIETDSKKSKPLGMLRFDPLQPDHAKFLAPVEAKPEQNNKTKKKAKQKQKQEEVNEVQPAPEGPKIEVSKEQFYKISDTLKEAIVQPSSFSLRSLFGNNDNVDEDPQEQETDYIPIETPKAKKVNNPLDPKERNPFVYDTSDSETDEQDTKEVKTEIPPAVETKAVWKENLFFSKFDTRLKEGLAFFGKTPETEIQKERRELKSLMKKRICNKDRKNQMFKNKIGGKKKSMKKPYRNKS